MSSDRGVIIRMQMRFFVFVVQIREKGCVFEISVLDMESCTIANLFAASRLYVALYGSSPLGCHYTTIYTMLI
jgi:hypothetical protein